MNFIIFLQDDGHLVMGSLFQLPAPVCYSDPSIIGTSIIRINYSSEATFYYEEYHYNLQDGGTLVHVALWQL